MPSGATHIDADGAVYREIGLSHGKVALVDASDYDELMLGPDWGTLRTVDADYAVRHVPDATTKGRYKRQYMHRLIMDAPDDLEVDHRDHDGLNNRRTNLRLSTHPQNCQNRRLPSTSTTKFKGVRWNARTKRYQARIMANGKSRTLGSFESDFEAAAAYDLAAVELHGQFAFTNAEIQAQAGSAKHTLADRVSAVRSAA